MRLGFVVWLALLGVALGDLTWWKSSLLYQIYPKSYADSNGDGFGDIKVFLCMVMQLILCTLLFLGVASAELPWWKSSINYQVFPRSFADSNGDGVGDIEGIIGKVPHLKDIGVGIIWLSPVYKSPQKDAGYDISDFRDISSIFGTIDDIKELIKTCHDSGIKFFMDFVPNHSSNEHPWFNASRHNVPEYKDYYVWRNPRGYNGSDPLPPNNWESVFGGSAWTYDTVRNMFYLHQFGYYQPDLNYANPKVIDEMADNLKFWLDMGVDGYRMDAVPFLVEDPEFKDEPICEDGHTCPEHEYTQHTNGTYKVLQTFVDRIRQNFKDTKTIFYEAYGPVNKVMKYYYDGTQPFNFQLIQQLKAETNATELKNVVDEYMSSLPNDAWPNWVVGNHDNSRVGSRLGPDFIDAANMLVLLLPGTSTTFQGEEIGMVDTYVRKARLVDTQGRDPCRTPMQWDDTINAGFSSSKNGTWLPVNPNYWYVNVQKEKDDQQSHLSLYKKMGNLRKELIESTELHTTSVSDWVFGFKRTAGGKNYYVFVNLNNIEEKVILNHGFGDIGAELKVVIPTANSLFKEGDTLNSGSEVIFRPRSGVVVSSSSMLLSSLALMLSGLQLIIFRN